MTSTSQDLLNAAMKLSTALAKGETVDENASNTINGIVACVIRQSEKVQFLQEYIKTNIGAQKLKECLNQLETNDTLHCEFRSASVNSVDEVATEIDVSESSSHQVVPNFSNNKPSKYQSVFASSQSQTRQPFTYHNPALFQGFMQPNFVTPPPVTSMNLMPFNTICQYQGVIKRIGDKYGWIESTAMNDDVFVHVSDIADDVRYSRKGQKVTCQISDAKGGRIKATSVRIIK